MASDDTMTICTDAICEHLDRLIDAVNTLTATMTDLLEERK